MLMLARWRNWAAALKRKLTVLYLASRDPRVSWPVKLLAAIVVAYALSPIDLVPDFIPVLGYLDDLVLVPFGLWIAFKLIPAAIIEEHRATAERIGRAPRSRAAAIVIVLLWLLLAGAAALWVWPASSS